MTPEFERRAAIVARASLGITPRLLRTLEVVGAATGYTLEDLASRGREKPLAHARQLAMFEARAAGFALQSIGRALGRDHSTISYGIRAEAQRREQ